MMMDLLALWLIRVARRLTSWGLTDDYLSLAEGQQTYWIENYGRDFGMLGRNPHD